MGDWQTWLHGLVAAFIGGGSSAVTAGIVAPAINPAAFNFHEKLAPLFQLAAALFVVNGGIAAFAYLSKSPLPDQQIITTVKKTSIQPAEDGGLKSVTVTKVTTESASPAKDNTAPLDKELKS